jgi:hypothetical protein
MATFADLVARFNSLDAQFASLKTDMIAFAQGQTNVVGETPPPAPVTEPNPMYEADINGLLTHVRSVSGQRVDPVVGPDCPNTRVCAKTGHVLSKARPDLGEMFVGYVQRVSDQITNGKAETIIGTVGALFLGTSTFFEHGTPGKQFNPDGSNWPEAADCFANMRAYMTDAEKERDDKAKAEWAEWNRIKQEQAANHPPVAPHTTPPVQPPELPPGEEPL